MLKYLAPFLIAGSLFAQTHTVEIQHQTQRMYAGAPYTYEVFTSQASLDEYITSTPTRAYAGQVVTLVEGGTSTVYAVSGVPGALALVEWGGGDPPTLQQVTDEGASTSNTIVAAEYAYPSNQRALPAAITIPTNATYTIAHTAGSFVCYQFAATTNDLVITITGPGTSYLAQTEVYWASGYTNRPVEWTNSTGALRWINDEPTTSEAQIMFLWTGTNAAAINTTVPVPVPPDPIGEG